MERSIIQWNAENWITVVLMVAIMYLFVGTIVTFLKTNLPSGVAGNSAGSSSAPQAAQ